MKHIFKILAIIFLCNLNLKANSNINFKAGYIISLKGDTTKGFLLVQESRNASEKCVFKLNADGEYKTYQPSEIAGYRFLNGKYYISKEIDIDSIRTKVVFLEFLIKGIASVYYYFDNEEHYYIEKQPNPMLELTEKERLIYVEAIPGRDGPHTYIADPRYKGKLMSELRDCPEINNKIRNTRLTHRSLIKLVKNYNQKVCNSNSCMIYEKKITAIKTKLGALIGYSKNQYDFGGQIASNYGDNFQIGAALKISNVFIFNSHFNFKVGFILEKELKPYTFSLSDGVHNYPITDNNNHYILNDIDYGGGASIPYLPSAKADLEVIDFKIPISLNYDFNITEKTTLTCGIGVSNKIILSQSKNSKIDYFFNAYGKSINTPLTGLIATAGIERKWLKNRNVFINLSYEYFTDFRSKIDYTFTLNNKQFSLQTGIYF